MGLGQTRHSGTVYQVAPGWWAWEPYSPHLGPLTTPRPDLLADGTRIGDKPGLETCVVSQVVADTLARLPLEGCRDTRSVHGGKRRERV